MSDKPEPRAKGRGPMHCVNFDFLAGVARRGERVIGAYSYGGAVSFGRDVATRCCPSAASDADFGRLQLTERECGVNLSRWSSR